MTNRRRSRVDSEAVRRAYLHAGGDAQKAAHELGMTRPNVVYHVRRANEDAPLRDGQGSVEDRAAIEAFKRASLDRVGVLHD